jgi:hypothetical protein
MNGGSQNPETDNPNPWPTKVVMTVIGLGVTGLVAASWYFQDVTKNFVTGNIKDRLTEVQQTGKAVQQHWNTFISEPLVKERLTETQQQWTTFQSQPLVQDGLQAAQQQWEKIQQQWNTVISEPLVQERLTEARQQWEKFQVGRDK